MENNEAKKEMPPYVINGKILYESPVPENPMLWGHFLPKIGIAMLVGDSECGKSSLMRQLSGAIAFDESEFLGLGLDTKHKRAMYVCSEDTDEDIKRIMKREHIGGRLSDPYENIHYVFDIDHIEDKIRTLLQSVPVDCVILDSLNDFVKGDTNNAFYARQFLERIRSMAMEFKCLFVLIHHFRKSAPDDNPSKKDVLGSQSFEAKARAVISMDRDRKSKGDRILRILKGNYVSEEQKDKVLQIHSDENFVFRTAKELLISRGSLVKSTCKIDEEIGELIFMLHSQGQSLRGIETSLKGLGHNISRTTINEFLKRQNPDVKCQES
jgi:RecA-family ATPase